MAHASTIFLPRHGRHVYIEPLLPSSFINYESRLSLVGRGSSRRQGASTTLLLQNRVTAGVNHSAQPRADLRHYGEILPGKSIRDGNEKPGHTGYRSSRDSMDKYVCRVRPGVADLEASPEKISASAIFPVLERGMDTGKLRGVPEDHGFTIGGLPEDKPLEIANFLKGKTILITGATGFLGKVLVEKILRVQPDISHLYLLIQPRAGVTPKQRLKSQILDAELFRVLRSKYGGKFEEFMEEKVTAVGGNITSPNLGISSQANEAIVSVLDLIVHSAANTRFDERYDIALQDNTEGPLQVMNFAKTCPKLMLFLHVSTAYANGNRKGNVHEKSFKMGDTITAEFLGSPGVPKLDIDHERRLVEDATTSGSDSDEEMIQLGAERAHMFGWHDVYTFSKAMGEMLLFENKGHVPLAIVRPSVVISTYREPFPGWIEGLRMMEPLQVPYGRGQMPGFIGTDESVVDLIPVDMVVNTILAAATKHYGREQQKTFVYQSSSGSSKPLTWRGMFDSFFRHYKAYPMLDKQGNNISVERYEIFEDLEEFERCLLDWQTRKFPATGMFTDKEGWTKDKQSERQQTLLHRIYESLCHLGRTYKPYAYHWGRFENHNTEALLRQICQNEQETFAYSVTQLPDWSHFLAESHLPGVRRYVLKGRATQGLKQEHME